jgi:hypothetical protein
MPHIRLLLASYMESQMNSNSAACGTSAGGDVSSLVHFTGQQAPLGQDKDYTTDGGMPAIGFGTVQQAAEPELCRYVLN